MRPQTDFMNILNKTIDDTIKGIMDDNVSEIYEYLQHHDVYCDKMGENPEALEVAMTEIFKSGWKMFKRAILRSLSRQLNVPMDKFADYSFAKCITIAETEFLGDRAKSHEMKDNVHKLKDDHNAIKLSLPQIELENKVKTCKLCGNNIDVQNNSERLLAELCDQCWELQNSVWEFPALEKVSETNMGKARTL